MVSSEANFEFYSFYIFTLICKIHFRKKLFLLFSFMDFQYEYFNKKNSIQSHSRWKKISETPAERQIPYRTNFGKYQNVTLIILESFASTASGAIQVGRTQTSWRNRAFGFFFEFNHVLFNNLSTYTARTYYKFSFTTHH